jgi:glycosyltransferase involved in cell wall biosynthesis
MRRYERDELAHFHQLIITSESDRDRLSQLIGQPKDIQVVRNGVDTSYFSPLSAPRITNSLVFCAKLDYFPNTQAILSFCQNILPRVWRRRPDTRLTIVGNNPPKAVHALSKDKRITVTGYVPDIRPYLGTASIALAPLLVAAGMQNKILEALAMGTPIVTTPHCSRTLGTQNGVHLLVAEETQAFADDIVKLLEDPLLAQQLGRAGRQFVIEHYSWATSANTLNQLYNSMIVPQRQMVSASVPDSRELKN